MPSIKFSIVTPSFNQAEFLEENIRSVLDQGYPAFEHIVIDGASGDGSVAILRKYPHLKWSSEPDRGQAAALNKGFRMATGDIVGWLNADDLYAPGALGAVAELFQDPQTVVVYGKGNEIDRSGAILREISPRGISESSFVRYWRWKYEYIQPSFFFRRSVLDAVGYLDESLHYVMDHEFFIRLIRRYPFTYFPSVLSSFRVHDRSKTGSTMGMALPPSIWELQKVSRRYWGRPAALSYWSHLLSFAGAVAFSGIKNLLAVRGSKARGILTRSRGRAA